MATYEFSSAAMSTCMANTYNFTGAGGSAGYSTYSSPLCWQNNSTVTAKIAIQKGATPTLPFTPLSLSSQITPNTLVEFVFTTHMSSTNGPCTNSMIGTLHRLQISSVFVNAVASGTATHFIWWFAYSATQILKTIASGTVGTTGSGADLIISDTNIVSGQPYKISNLAVTLDSAFTYT